MCHALNLQRYPDGITAIDANNKCGKSGIENNPLVLTKISKLYGNEFWTGLGIYTQLTAWIDILGCFQLSKSPSTVYTVSSPGLCEQGCLTRYFGYNKETTMCSCLNNSEIQLASGTNLSSCVRKTDKADLVYMVYKTYNGTIQTPLVDNGLCTTLICSYSGALVLSASCEGNYDIKSVCEDGMQSTSSTLWGLTQNQTSVNCRRNDKLLLNTSACQYLSQNLTARAWTNVFREEIEVLQKLGELTATPTFCLSAIISDKGDYIIEKLRHNCSSKLEWFVCKTGWHQRSEEEYS
ncbi:Hypothetical predicted protein [Mytilus galloprovincialis]|uniref:Uncharacterized protein n=1 Tax=Mytilus galloprovincialis TaxID=29158 RepID=A0A8B6FHF6_MYTGA|nr:Hypothetical predicted protein [Mytilus galloprovincialis]